MLAHDSKAILQLEHIMKETDLIVEVVLFIAVVAAIVMWT